MPVYKVSAIVLRRRNLGEADKIVTYLTRERGKLSIVAKGSRKPTSRLAAATELFVYCRLVAATGRNLDVLTQSETRHPFLGLREDLNRFAHAAYLSEIVDRAVEEHDPHPDLFDLLLAAFYQMESGRDPELVSPTFIVQAASLLGYQPELETCVRCARPLEEPQLGFSPTLGGLLCSACSQAAPDILPFSQGARVVLRQLRTAETADLDRLRPPRNIRRQIQEAMEAHLKHHLSTGLKSTDFLHRPRPVAQE